MDANQKKYPYLPPDREILYVPKDNFFIMEAEKVAREESNDLNNPTGAVIVKNGKIVSKTSNKNFLNSKFLINLHKKVCIRKIFKVPTGTKYKLCPGCTNSESHAEKRAVEQALEKNIDIRGADLYLWGHWWCCQLCWNAMIESGIRKVYLVEEAEKLFKRK